jgi:hypothetical protein
MDSLVRPKQDIRLESRAEPMSNSKQMAAIATGQIAALTTLLLMLVEKGVIERDEAIEAFERAAAEAAKADNGQFVALPSKQIADLLRKTAPEIPPGPGSTTPQ